MAKTRKRTPTLAQIRTAVADYMQSEGCGCCGDRDAHTLHTAALAKLLRVPPHPEQAGYFPFVKYRSKS